jgi:hypothetical protein
MKNHHHRKIHDPAAPAVDCTPSHESISERAHEMWIEKGRPDNCSTAIWLEAEAELVETRSQTPLNPDISVAGP